MGAELEKLLQRARHVTVDENHREQQRQSFVYGNTHIENPLITRETVAEQALELSKKDE